MLREGNWIGTNSNKRLYILDPRPEDFCLEDIAISSSHLCRYLGHCDPFYSVAEHEWRVMNAMHQAIKRGDHSELSTREVNIALAWALLHDSHEVVTGDFPGPFKKMPVFAELYKPIEEKINQAIATQFNLPLPIPSIVKYYDNILLVTEMRDLMPYIDVRFDYHKFLSLALPNEITPMSSNQIRTIWLAETKHVLEQLTS